MAGRGVTVVGVLAVVAIAGLVVDRVSAGADDVVVLTKDNFKEVIGKDLVMVKFFAPWCGHCKSMKADFEKAATALKDKAVLADLDATEEKELAQEYGVRGFPTLKIFANGEFLQDYKGGRDEKSIVEFMERATEPAYVTYEKEADLKKFMDDNKDKVRVVGVALDEEAGKLFRRSVLGVADSVGGSAVYAAVSDAALAKEYAKVEAGAFFMVKPEEDGSEVLEFTKDDGSLEDWIKSEAMPVFGLLNPGTAQMYVDAGVPLFVVFSDAKELDAEVQKTMTGVAKALKSKAKGKLTFVWTDESLASFRDHVGLKGKDPAVCIYVFEGDAKFLYPGEKITTEGITDFANQYLDGELKPVLKSDPIPESNDEPVKIVVGDTWADIVEDNDKDVLVEQYAPWCGHCKKLTPIYDELAETLGEVETVVIAKMDATTNDAPAAHKASGFPTIKLFPAGGKDPVEFEGDRTKDGFLAFLKEHATHKFEVPEFKPDEEVKEEL